MAIIDVRSSGESSKQVPVGLPALSPKAWGRIEVAPAPDHPLNDVSNVSVEEYCWTPGVQVADLFPPEYILKMACLIDDTGFRRFVPFESGGGQFLVSAAAGGMAVITRHLKSLMCEDDQRASTLNRYRFLSLIFQWSFNKKRGFRREIRRIEDLRLRSNERSDSSELTVIPSWLLTATGDNRQAELRPLGLSEFIKQGWNEARRLGRDQPNEVELIRCIIIAAARTDPFRLMEASSDRLFNLICKSLLADMGHDVRPDAERKAEIEERLWQAYQKYDLLTTTEFNRRFFEDLDNLVHQIAKRKRTGFKVSRPQVNQVFSELIGEAHQKTSQLVRQQMNLFRHVLPQPLSREESIAFNTFYDCQPWCGDLIPLMLYSRFKLLEPLMSELQFSEPSAEAQAAVINAIFLNTEMVKARREGDRQRKKQTLRDQTSFRFARSSDFVDENTTLALLDQWAAELREGEA